MSDRLQCKNIPDDVVLGAVATLSSAKKFVSRWELADRVAQDVAAFAALPEADQQRLLRAKCAALIASGKLYGCAWVSFDDVSAEDRARLEELGFLWDEDDETWVSYRFGSA